MSEKSNLTKQLKQKALDIGFCDIKIAKAVRLDEEEENLSKWLLQKAHGEMGYLANHFEIRLDPKRLVEDAQTVICLAFNYYPENETLSKQGTFKIARYAYGEDYHDVLRKKLKELLQFLVDNSKNLNGRVFVDSAPIMERVWAKKAGLGWVGKHTLLINPKKGSYFFLAEIVIDQKLDYDEIPIKDHCGTCTRCIEACPTDAISRNGYWLDASKCISYLTIELKNEISNSFVGKMEDWIFGCDICQEVCPWNRFSMPHKESTFVPKPALKDFNKKEWIELTQEAFQQIFDKSAIKRTKYQGLMRNILFVEKK
jgi:epoxyqueuosine reductase